MYTTEVDRQTAPRRASDSVGQSVGDVTVAINPADLVVLSEGADQLI